jgi:hypothetical protein
VGLNENFWDRAGPVPGFGDLDPDLDVQRMVSDLLGEGRDKVQADLRPGTGEPGTGEENVASSQVEDAPGESQLPPTIASASPVAEDEIPQPSENAATQKEVAEPPSAKKVARRHGGAIPQ